MKTGDKFERYFEVSDDVYNGFINIFNDRNPLHVDNEFAVSKGFKEKVMHGNILSGFLSYMVGECLPDKNVIILSQEINFRKPVYLGEKLKLTFVVKEIFESVGTIQFRFDFFNSENVKAASGNLHIKHI